MKSEARVEAGRRMMTGARQARIIDEHTIFEQRILDHFGLPGDTWR
jgi:hypothetical protein